MDLLTTLLQTLDAPLARYATLDSYYAGTQPLAFLSPEAKAALGTRFGVMSSNLPRLAVTALAERLRVTGFRTGGKPNAELWADWKRNDLDQLAGVAHREALLLGDAYVIVWGNDSGPQVSIESARQVAVLRDPGTRQIVAAVKRWETLTTTEAVLYECDKITRLRAQQVGATTAGFEKVGEPLANPFGIPPVVALSNADRLLVYTAADNPPLGASEVDDLIPLVDGLNKSLSDMLVSSEYAGRPRRWASGIELIEEDVLDDDGVPTGTKRLVNPFPEGTRMMTAEDPAAKFGALPAADLASYESSVRVMLGQIAAVSALPAHYLGVLGDQPPSADSLRAAEASLTARARAAADPQAIGSTTHARSSPSSIATATSRATAADAPRDDPRPNRPRPL